MSDSVGSVSVDVVPDARGWSEKLRAQLRDQTVKIQADADTTEANAQLDEAARTRTAKIKADVSQFSQGASKLDQFVGNLRLLPALAIVAGSALIPLAGVLGGIAAALAAPLVIAGGGATLFAFMAGFAVKDTEKQLKAISTAQAKLAGLTKGTKEYAAAQKEVTSLQKGLSPAQRQFSNAQSNLSASFQDFIGGKAGVALLGPLTQGMKLLAQILPSLTPVLVTAGGAFSTLLGDLGKAASGPGFDKFIKLVSGQVAHDILGFGHVLGNIASGLGGLFVQLDKKVGGDMVDQLVKLSGAFSRWANSDKGRKAIQSFLNYAHDNGPQVAHTLGSVARSIGHIVEALAPLGPPTLRVIQGIADALSGIPIPVLTALAAATVGMVGFQKVGGFKAASFVGKIAGGADPLGVQKVFVTNPGFGSTGGGPGGFLGKLAKVGKWAIPGVELGGEALTVTSLGAVVATGVVAGLTTYGLVKVARAENSPVTDTQHPNGSNLTPAQYRALNAREVHNEFPNVPEIKSTTTSLDSIHQQARDASRSLDLVGAHAKLMEKQTVRSIHNMTGTTGLDSVKAHAAAASRQLELVGPHGEQGARQAEVAARRLGTHLEAVRQHAADASRSLDVIGPIAAKSIHTAQNAADTLNHHLDVLARRRTADVYLNDHGALARIAAIQYAVDQLHGKTIVVRTTGGHTVIGQKAGGPVVGPGTGTSDSVPRMLSNGEFVVNARSAAQNRALLEQINSGRAPSYAPSSSAHSGPGLGGPVNLVLDDGTTLRAHFEGIADGVYQANGAYEDARRGA